MIKLFVNHDEYTGNESRDFYLKLPKAMYKSFLEFMSALEEESFARDREMQARNELAKQKR